MKRWAAIALILTCIVLAVVFWNELTGRVVMDEGSLMGASSVESIANTNEYIFSGDISSCMAAEDKEKTIDIFKDRCDGNYESGAACGQKDDLLGCDDGYAEEHNFQYTGNVKRYAGLLVGAFNPNEINCTSINSVFVCYEWWSTEENATDCIISVDANGDGSWSNVTNSCPGTVENPGVTCVDVTSLENWGCGNFFGADGARALLKSEITREFEKGTPDKASWDVLYFNVNYYKEAFIAASLSSKLASGIYWNVSSLPANNLDAKGNNENGTTDYYVDISAEGISADLYVRANSDLTSSTGSIIGLENERYGVNPADGSIPNTDRYSLTTSFSKIGDNLVNGNRVHLKFFLNVPPGQEAGAYNNTLSFKIVAHGTSP